MPPPIPLPVGGPWTVGREAADLTIPLPTVSARHATLTVSDAGVIVADAGSTNGSYVALADGASGALGAPRALEPGVPARLAVGDAVVFGDMFLAAFRLDEAGGEEEGGGAAAA